MLSARTFSILGWTAVATAVSMYLSYIHQIHINLSGGKGSWIQPLIATINCILWCLYGLAGPRRDWPVFLANAPGVVLGCLAFLTAF